jgi:hypothetical protein
MAGAATISAAPRSPAVKSQSRKLSGCTQLGAARSCDFSFGAFEVHKVELKCPDLARQNTL